MKITTGLPHEKDGGYTLALFGEPRHVFISKKTPTIYVDCHIIKNNVSHLDETSNTYEDIHNVVLSPNILKRLYSRARKAATAYAKKMGWSLEKTTSEYVQNNSWKGFMFNAKR